MAPLKLNTVGILPAGALGVGFFYHLTQQLTQLDGDVFFIARRESRSSEMLRQAGSIRIAPLPSGRASERPEDESDKLIQTVPTAKLLKPDLLQADEFLPEIVLACPNPDQILPLITTTVELLVQLYESDRLDVDPLPMPMLVLASNGIYFQRFRQILIEKLEEATLFGRLPDLWPELMPRIISRFLRGVTIQTGLREGNGADTLYRPGPRGITRIAGGDRPCRQRCSQVLTERGGWFEAIEDRSATRLEFDKALLNLAANLLGQLYAIDESGQFNLLTIGEISAPDHHADMMALAHHVFQVGLRVRAYSAKESFKEICDRLFQTSAAHASHVPSSLQWVDLNLRRGTLKPEMTPTESWLLEPLLRYARASDLPESVAFFEGLKQQLLDKLSKASGRSLTPTG
ncbi:MAG: hypothetical protein WBA57_25225 [Elainellaceae cyanobacterium]